MNELLEFIDELKELEALYQSGELREFDFQMKINKYKREVEKFERAMEAEAAQHELFFGGTPFSMSREV
jgi:hypothetical protein